MAGLEEGEGSIQKMLLKISHVYFTKIFQQMAGFGVHPGQLPLIRILGSKGGISQKEISRQLHIKPPTVAVSIKRLEKIGLLERKVDSRDQRVTRIYLTEAGEQVYRETWELMKKNEKLLFQGFTESEMCLLKRFFQQIADNLEKFPVNETTKIDFKCGKE